MDKQQQPEKKKRDLGLIMAIIAITINLVTVSIYIYQARIMSKQQELAAWPYLEWRSIYNEADGMSLIVRNNGIGPALVKNTEMRLSGEIMVNQDSLFIQLLGTTRFPHLVGNIENRVLPAGESVKLIQIKDGEYAEKVFHYMLDRNFEFDICFESIYGDRWKCKGLEVIEGGC
ncbi:MAG: hypothetical protein AAGG59_06670 [Bacteroidota bacterium]